jgi:hypothetical protein
VGGELVALGGRLRFGGEVGAEGISSSEEEVEAVDVA